MSKPIDFQTHPTRYKHWQLSIDGQLAWLRLDVDASGGLSSEYELKLNSYDLSVDIELADAVQRLRFEQPGVKCVILCSGKDNVFCAGANIRMLSVSSHAHKVNFCKFTNETRLAIEDATEHSGQIYISALNGTSAGGGYELAMCTQYIILADDSNSSVSLPEVPLLGVLPGTGGLTRLTDKRKVRRDLADVFCTTEEGVKGQKALDWKLVDELIPKSNFEEGVSSRAVELIDTQSQSTHCESTHVTSTVSNSPGTDSGRPDDLFAPAIVLTPLDRSLEDKQLRYGQLTVELDHAKRTATFRIQGPNSAPVTSADDLAQPSHFNWVMALAEQLDDAMLHLRFNEPELSLWCFHSKGGLEAVSAHTTALLELKDNWIAREVIHYWKRVLKRLELSSRTNFAFVESGSCFSGILSEVMLACDRTYMFDSESNDSLLRIDPISLGVCPMGNGLSRLHTRFYNDADAIQSIEARIGQDLNAQTALDLGLITDAFDDIDWEDEIRLAIEQRTSYSGDALTGMEANLRYPGPETLETKIFARLSAWQNWIFQRPDAAGEKSALSRYGSGTRPEYDRNRV